ncbi:transporter substrate-binding domain-containing protein [Xanthobacter pseudotagetidis]|uniref:transporter substrate-binding domain-containing protein n=1 Tax=Xanthobacter pseudotagetidis TaxID=3119911 RepID=UPI0037297673
MSKFNALRLGAVAAASLAGAFLATLAPAAADALADIEKAKVIKIAVPQDFAPFGSAGLDLKPQGYDIDMANYIGKALGVKVEIVPVTSANRIPYLQTKKVDLVISSLGKNAEREKVIDFSVPYAPFFSGVYGIAGEKIASADALANKTVGATRGAIEEQELTKLAPASATIKRYEDNNATISAFISGQVDLIATGNTVAAVIAEKSASRKPELKFVIKDSPCYVGLNKDEPALLAKVNEIIAKAKTDGTLEQFSQKWLKQPLPATF